MQLPKRFGPFVVQPRDPMAEAQYHIENLRNHPHGKSTQNGCFRDFLSPPRAHFSLDRVGFPQNHLPLKTHAITAYCFNPLSLKTTHLHDMTTIKCHRLISPNMHKNIGNASISYLSMNKPCTSLVDCNKRVFLPFYAQNPTKYSLWPLKTTKEFFTLFYRSCCFIWKTSETVPKTNTCV